MTSVCDQILHYFRVYVMSSQNDVIFFVLSSVFETFHQFLLKAQTLRKKKKTKQTLKKSTKMANTPKRTKLMKKNGSRTWRQTVHRSAEEEINRKVRPKFEHLYFNERNQQISKLRIAVKQNIIELKKQQLYMSSINCSGPRIPSNKLLMQ